ncbi:hypothetical protein CANARDRAFT_23923 [[Candida] arabinofermentans NRRL YB-2248]|uniref:Anaphase spindle elongation protein n=1 Tax=[Candida] arabinofermentans NRRL YB-2248 TaxID=983967 RepID=A0A1E4SYF7_9ASCO|nr:hypothetical protein CANARDRAFT_23923 [[Candida] arabinofermentans NRRL YB-2248]
MDNNDQLPSTHKREMRVKNQQQAEESLLTNLSPDQIQSILSIIKKNEQESVSHESLKTGVKRDEEPNTVDQQNAEIEENNLILDETAQHDIQTQNIINTLNNLRNKSLVIGDSKSRLRNWLHSINSMLASQHKELLDNQNHLENEFTKSLATLSKVFNILRHYQAEMNEDLLLSFKIQKILNDYRYGTFTKLVSYCNEEYTMTKLNNEIESDIIKLRPVLLEKVFKISSKLNEFYNYLEKIDSYSNPDFLNEIPTREETTKFLNVKELEDIKEIMLTKFNKTSPSFLKKIETEVSQVKLILQNRIQEVKDVINSITSLSESLEMEVSNVPEIKTDDDIVSKIGLKTHCLNEMNKVLESLKKVESERQQKLDIQLKRTEELWEILRPNDNSIQRFLKINKNLKLSSLENFDALLIQLEDEKKVNMSKFIQSCRSRIEGYWDILMYDEQERNSFDAFFETDLANFDENLLELHNLEINKLRQEIETVKPLLELIASLNQLLNEKHQLDEASKDPKRLLKSNSFNILEMERKQRNRVNRLLPSTIERLKEQLKYYENIKGKVFKVDGRPYSERLEGYESEFTRLKSVRKITSQRVSQQPATRPSSSSTQRRNQRIAPKLPTSALRSSRSTVPPSSNRNSNNGSIIRRYNPDEVGNPFDSKDSSPIRRPNTTGATLLRQPSIMEESLQSLRKVDPPIFRKRAYQPSIQGLSDNNERSTNGFLTGGTISKTPIVIMGGSPMRQSKYQRTELPSQNHTALVSPARKASDTKIPTFTPRSNTHALRTKPELRLNSNSPDRSKPTVSPPSLKKKNPSIAGLSNPLDLKFTLDSLQGPLVPLSLNSHSNGNDMMSLSPKLSQLKKPIVYNQSKVSPVAVEELSDSMIDYNEDTENKENSRIINYLDTTEMKLKNDNFLTNSLRDTQIRHSTGS